MEPDNGAEELARLLPAGARRLLADHVHSAGELDLLMLLHGDRARTWDVEEICGALRCPRAWAVQQLGANTAAGLVAECDGRYACRPASPQLDDALYALASARDTRWAELAQLVAVPRRRRSGPAASRRRLG